MKHALAQLRDAIVSDASDALQEVALRLIETERQIATAEHSFRYLKQRFTVSITVCRHREGV